MKRALRIIHYAWGVLQMQLRRMTMSRRQTRGWRLCSAWILCSATFAFPAVAQQGSDGSEVQLAVVEEISVTGSRIQRTGMTTPTPVTVMSSEELSYMAPTTLMDALSQMPQFANNNTAVGFSDGVTGSAGASNVNLRGVGPNRTLVLLDGRRVVPSTRRGSVDVGLFPKALIQRVELVTGGASAAYGSDAVSGVANFILNTEFTGLEAQVQAGRTSRGDNDTQEYSLAGGLSVGERGHLVFGGEHFNAEGIRGYGNREWFQSWGNIANPDPNGPAQVIVPNIRSRSYTYGGVITAGPFAGTQFLEGGVPAPFYDGDIVTPMYQAGGSGVDDGSINTWVVPDQRRTSGFARFTYDVSDDLQLSLQGVYGNSMTRFHAVPSALQYASTAEIFSDNAFLPDSMRIRMENEGIASFRLARLAREDDLGAALVTNDGELYSATLGFQGRAGAWLLDGYYQYGRTNELRSWDNVVRVDRLYRAIDAVEDASGRIVCRSTLQEPGDGCVPMNVFGAGAPSQEAKEYLWARSYADQVVTQHVVELVAQRDLFDLWAGTVSMATGASYREDSFDQVAGPQPLASMTVPPAGELYRGQPPGTVGGGLFERANPSTVAGGYDVWEVFLESVIPLMAQTAFARGVDLNLAARYADYAGSGGVWAWKGGVDWSMTDALRLRLTRSRDIRAGNLSERFDTTGRGGNVEADHFLPGAPGYVTTQIEGGNPNVEPETADTLTFGVVYQPSWATGLSMSVDYYDIKISGAIDQLGVQMIIDECYRGAAGLCDLITRNPDTGLITEVQNVFLNVAEARTRGVDIEASYTSRVDLFGTGGQLTIRGFGTYIDELSTTNFGAPKVDRAGQTGRYVAAPRFRGTAGVMYTSGPLSIYLQQRYIGSGKRDVLSVEGVDIDDNTVSSAWYTNARLGYDLDAGGANIEVYGNITNLFDKDPPRAPTANPYSTVHTNEELFDPLGRRYMVGLRVRY